MISCWFAHLIAECVFICSCPVCFLYTSEFQEYSQLILDIAALWRYNLISCEWLTFIHAHTHTHAQTQPTLCIGGNFSCQKAFITKIKAIMNLGCSFIFPAHGFKFPLLFHQNESIFSSKYFLTLIFDNFTVWWNIGISLQKY